MARVALRYGFTDYRVIYEHPDNAPLKKKRPNPNVLHPGDRVVIPDKDVKVESGFATDRLHRFRLRRPRKELRVRLLGHDGSPLAGVAYTLEIAGREVEGTTDDDGRLKHEVPIDEGVLNLKVAGRVLRLQTGHLNPLNADDDGVTGAQARLLNLGYDPGPADGTSGRRTRAALALFQHDEKLDVSGRLDEGTRERLTERHGS